MAWRQISAGVMVAVMVLSQGPPAFGAFGFGDIVFDPSNYAENLATAISTAATVQEAIQIARNTLLDIISLPQVILKESTFVQELEELWSQATAIVNTGQDVSRRFSNLFGTENLPAKAYWYSVRRSEVFELKRCAAQNASAIQGLVKSTAALFSRIGLFIEQIGVVVGGKQASLTQLQVQLETVKALKEDQVRQAAMDQLQILEKMDESSAVESLKLINQDVYKNWPEGN